MTGRQLVFLLMFLAVAVPTLLGLRFPEKPTGLAKAFFNEVEELPAGSKVLVALDYDPASEGELGPMATSLVRHVCERGHKLYFMTLWPVGEQMIDQTIREVIDRDFPEMTYGEDYVNLGFKAGQEGVIKVIATDLRELYPTDAKGVSLDAIPMTRDLRDLKNIDLIANVSAGYPGTKEWVQYAGTPLRKPVIGGCTGVQAPLLYPYVPQQLPGLLGAIKGAAEYEELVADVYDASGETPRYLEARRRMGPQLVAHLLMVGLIVAGNGVYLWRKSGGAAR